MNTQSMKESDTVFKQVSAQLEGEGEFGIPVQCMTQQNLKVS